MQSDAFLENSGRRGSIFGRILFGILTVSFIIIATSGGTSYYISRKLIRTSVHEQIVHARETAANSFRIEYEIPIERDLLFLESSPALNNFLMSPKSELLIRRADLEKLFYGISKNNLILKSSRFIDAIGQERIIIQEGQRVRNYRHIGDLAAVADMPSQLTADLYDQLKSQEARTIHATAPFAGSNGELRFLVGISKLEPEAGGFGGVIVHEVDLSGFIERLSQIRLFDAPVVLVRHPDGQILSAAKDSTSDPEEDLETIKGKRQTYTVDLPVAGQGILHVEFDVPERLIAHQLRPLLWQIAVVSIVLITIAVAIALLISSNISRPIRELANASSRIGLGDFSQLVSVSAHGEIGELAKTFNRMTSDLKRTTVSRDYTDNILRSMNDCLIVLSLDFKIVTVNKSACRLLEYEERDLSELRFGDIVGEETCKSLIDDIRKKQRIANVEVVYRSRSRREIFVLFSGAVLRNPAGKIDGFVTVAMDNTERRQVIADLKIAKEQAEQANITKSEFLANMSHELRTPLHGILSFAGFGLRKSLSADPTKLLGYFTKIDRSGRILLQLLNDLLDLAKLESGMMTYHFTKTNVSTLVHAVADEFGAQLAEREMHIDCKSVSNGKPIDLDPERISQVVRNLLSNAMKFSPDGGTIELTVTGGHDATTVSVQDSGHGIPEDELDTVFDKFVQSKLTNTGAGGTGLGLSICREIVSAHKGRIWAEAPPDNGALIKFEISNNLRP